MMNLGIKLRLAALSLAVGLMGWLIAVVTLNSQRQAGELRARLTKVEWESLGIAEQFKNAHRELNDQMRHYRAAPDPAIWEEFLKASHELDVWIEQQTSRLTTPVEEKVLKQMGLAYSDYVRMAKDLHAKIQSSRDPNSWRAEADAFYNQSRRLADLGEDLARAHSEQRDQLLAHANASLTQLRYSVLGLLGLLFVFATALAAVAYRDLIAPLRLKLVESQALAERQEKLASLGMLAAGVAHEIRNPLTAIKAAVFIQQKKAAPGSQDHADTELIGREISRLERIVNDFLSFARPTKPDLASLPVQSVLEEVRRLLEPALTEANIRLVLGPSPAISIKADLAQIKQVLINLVQNAADSIGRDGTITLQARPDKKQLRNGLTEVAILEVTDTGKGISPDVAKRLFDPLFTTKDNGTGLGLSIAARIVEQHGGRLQYQTRMNVGTTFGIVLPRSA